MESSIIFRELSSGTILANGKYIIESVIGSGGFGITYLVRHTLLNETCAMKEFFIDGTCVRNTQNRTVQVQTESKNTFFEKYREKFIEEARTLKKLDHPNIVKIEDVFEENNTAYIVMPFIRGKTLQRVVEEKGRLDYSTAINYIGQLTDAVDYIHKRNILHRDIKPENIIITPANNVVLIDFGAAREFENDKTQMNTVILSQGYAPPEQYSTVSRKGSYSDIYSIGAVFYFALTGQKPTDASTRTIEKMPAPKDLFPDIPEEINRTIMKAMQLKIENRHQTVQDFTDDLLNRRPSTLVDETIGGGGSNKKNIIFFGVALLIIVVVGIIYLIYDKNNNATIPSLPYAIENESFNYEDFTGGMYPMVKIEGGTFQMGSSNPNDDDETHPVHSVTLDSYYIGKYEVTQKFWEEIMGSKPSCCFEGDSLPVESVNMNMVNQFIQELNMRTEKTRAGRRFALPTEAEWEYAARGGQKSKGYVYAGSNTPGRVANFNGENTQKVGGKTNGANELGIYDMNGNVAEWCSDFYSGDYYKEPYNNKNPENNIVAKSKVVRGGSFEKERNVFYRDEYEPNVKSKEVGFRLILK